LLEPSDFPSVLAHAQRVAAGHGYEHFGLEISMVNQAAVKTLLGQGFRIDPFIAILMNDKPIGNLENYIATSPPFFL
jgi:hypothetical protein